MSELKDIERTRRFSRRAFLTTTVAGLGSLAILPSTRACAEIVQTDFSKLPPYGNGTLPMSVRSRYIDNVNGLTVHTLEAGYETAGRPPRTAHARLPGTRL
jgi:hypothetical protein